MMPENKEMKRYVIGLIIGIVIGMIIGNPIDRSKIDSLLREKQWFLNEHNRLVEEVNFMRTK